jgi:putative membrane protein insertion efficiency factor
MYRNYKKDANKITGYIVLFVIRTMKAIFLMPSGSCKYYPTCSNYAKEAFEKYNIIKAIIKIIIRILKCNPLSKGGFDPV